MKPMTVTGYGRSPYKSDFACSREQSPEKIKMLQRQQTLETLSVGSCATLERYEKFRHGKKK